MPKTLSKAVANRAARAAGGIASPPMIASLLGEKLPQKVIAKMEQKGITVTIDEVFREGVCSMLYSSSVICTEHADLTKPPSKFSPGPYVVFQIQVIKVDAVVLANSRGSKKEMESRGVFEIGSLIGVGLGLIGSNNQQWVEEGYLPMIVQKKLQTSLNEILAEKMEEKNLMAETVVLGESKQSRYFFAKYREIQSIKPVGFSNRMRLFP